MMAFLSSFTEPFMLSVMYGILASVVLTLPILAILYHRRNRLEFGTVMSVYLSILYAFALVFFTLYPLPENGEEYCATHHLYPQFDWFQFITDIKQDGRAAILQIAFNIIFFVPLGFILKRLARWHWYAIIPAGFAVSFLIETAQGTGLYGFFPCAYRLFDVDDLLTNTLGAVVGLWLALLWNAVDPPETDDKPARVVTKPGFIRRGVAYLIDSIIISTAGIVAAIPFAILLGSGARQGAIGDMISLTMILLFQGVIPWLKRGQTLAGRFVHMTFETKQRSGGARVAFYVFRLAVLSWVMLWAAGGWLFWTFVTLLGFWIFTRGMPYDLLPGIPYGQEGFSLDEESTTAPSEQLTQE